jgi:hypothetical protein
MSNHATLPSAKKKARNATIAVPYWLREFALIRLAVVICAGAIGIGFSSVFASSWWLHDALDTRQLAQQSRDAAYARFAQVESEKQDIRNFQPKFIALSRKGLIGEESRLEWVDDIRQIQEQHRLLPLTYEFEPQQTVRQDGRLELGDYQLRASRMSLHMDMLHEGDLFDFLAELRQRGYFAVQDCTFKRLAGVQNVANAPTVGADCHLDWLTLAPAGAAKVATVRRSKR